nr:hypothetical protein [Tanacetum cinerariifolium]
MVLMISNGQKNTLTEYMILFGADNRPPMLNKDLYDSWKSIMKLYMQNREHERMILESVERGPLIWPTIEENGVTRTKKYVELSPTEKIQADCDMKAINIILQDLESLLTISPSIYALPLDRFDNNVSFEEELAHQRLRKTLTHVLELSLRIYLDDRAWEVLNFDSAGVRL